MNDDYEALTHDRIADIVARIIERGKEARQESNADKSDDFKKGRALAYYEVADILQSELSLDGDLSDFGLDIDLMKTLM